MRIAVMGAGALGLYYGGRLAAAGVDVRFVARGANLAALRAGGLRIESPLGDLHLPAVTAAEDPAEIGPVDLVLFLVKLPDAKAAAEAMRPLLGPETAALSLQNGVEARAILAAVLPPGRVMGGMTQIPAVLSAPGAVRHGGPFARVVFGEFDGAESPRARALRDAFARAGVEAHLVPDVEARIWEKFTFLSAFSGMTALCRLPIGPVREAPASRGLLARAVEEADALGRRLCPGLAADNAARAKGFIDGVPPTMRSSMLEDLERGRPLELPWLSGAVARLSAAEGLAAPVQGFVAAALAPWERGRPAGA